MVMTMKHGNSQLKAKENGMEKKQHQGETFVVKANGIVAS